ncbi:hypothetical protein EON79_00695 [bacterium]|nr:MAG: hypothetical protein EON79_00695 [bacterium]
MAEWRVELLGPLRVSRDGHAVKLRTLQQGLLLAHLATGEGPLDRSETAASLWPEAERENALAYLRRAIMELRKTGIEIETPPGQISVDHRSFSSDIDELLRLPPDSFSMRPGVRLLDGADHPAADEIRIRLQSLLIKGQRRAAKKPGFEPSGREALNAWLGETLVRERPEIAIRLMEDNMPAMVGGFAMEPILDLCLNTIESAQTVDPPLIAIQGLAARLAQMLTRYSLAEKLHRRCIEDAESLGRIELAIRSLANLAFLQMELRRWPEAKATALRSVEEADRTGNVPAIETAHANLAGIQWHLGEFEDSVRNYRTAIEVAPEERRLTHIANLAYVEGVFGIPAGMDFRPSLRTFDDESYQTIADGYLRFACGMIDDDAVEAALGARLLVESTSKGTLDRLLCIALDCAAMALARLGRHDRAAACVRVGTRVRNDVAHARSPGEAIAIRRNVPTPYFGPGVARVLEGLDSDEPSRLGRAVIALL